MGLSAASVADLSLEELRSARFVEILQISTTDWFSRKDSRRTIVILNLLKDDWSSLPDTFLVFTSSFPDEILGTFLQQGFDWASKHMLEEFSQFSTLPSHHPATSTSKRTATRLGFTVLIVPRIRINPLHGMPFLF